MIINFDFEGEWYDLTDGLHKTLPLGWEPYGDPDKMPEYGFPHKDDVHLDSLVKTGMRSIQYGWNWHTHDAGVLTRIVCHPGDLIHFWMHGRYIYDGPSENVKPGDTVGDIHMRIGIGSTRDAVSAVWSPEQEISVQGYGGTPDWFMFEIKTIAPVDFATLFLYTNPTWAGFRGNGPVWDDGGVEITTPAEECWGQPREQFASKMYVAPDAATAHQVINDHWPISVTNSFDQPGIGMNEDKTAALCRIPLVQRSVYTAWYKEHYPRTRVEFVYNEVEEPEMALYSQRDPRWRDYVYGGGQTLGKAGCLITNIAMLTGDEPPVVAQKLADVGALQGAYLSRPELIPDAYPDLPYGGTVHWRTQAADIGKLAEWLELGPVIVETEFTPGGAVPPEDQHFVIALELDGDDLVIADPWTGEITRLLERYASPNWDLARAIYGVRLVGISGGDPPPPPLSNNLLGLHIQRPVEGIPEYYAATKPSVFKTVQNFQTCVGIKAVSPKTLTIIRPYPNDVRGVGAVRDIVAGIADDLRTLHPYVDYVEFINEQVASNDEAGTRLAVLTEIAGMEALKALGVPVKPLILNVAVGNPWGPWDPMNEQLLLLPAIEAAESLFGPGGYGVGYHGYHPSNLTATYLTYANVNGIRSYVGKYYAFRWMEWDKDFTVRGFYPNYIQTEMGPMGTHGPRPEDGYIDMLGYDGWRSGRCLGGNRSRLIDELSLWQAELAAWNASHGNRALGGTIFTTGGGSKWSTFAFHKPEMDAWQMRLES